ncbi:putative protein family UPF0324 [Gemmatirosa kalamazoonensis]|uniref:Sulfate exporter family transporter n=1 Tax=Gemmatirosa kalamazoonensis TaxID=861299 RepID=W0RBK9_9BACT|nr:putative sulfate exporter family transporter [Gemmatirosa kalamazoonensis]AHG88494.1 putative protein family UPF0324 [Gemmatirosa kalamazoonensis]
MTTIVAEESPSYPAPLLPGLALTAAIGVASWAIAWVEQRAFGHPVVEALVVAILLGMVVRTLRAPSARAAAGVRFAAKELLEAAVFLLGASVDLPLLVRAGPALAVGIVLLVVLGLACSYALGRTLGLPRRLAVLVACGNSICGNSAIAAVAPVIDAEPEHVATAIAFTAVLGVCVVLGLPLLVRPLGLSLYQYGVLAGLTVYAVPQVLAAAFPVSVLSGQVGTLVKLVRVLMLGPVVLFFAVRHRGERGERGTLRIGQLGRLVPWFIVGFLALAALRALGLVPPPMADVAKSFSGWLTIAAMAALGLGVDVRAVSRVGRPVVLTVTGSLAVLVVLSVTLIRVLAIR